MKRTILLGIGSVLGVGLLASMMWVGVTSASDFRGGTKPTLTSSETTDSALYAGGDSVVVAGTVKGDLWCGGNNIDITGTVEGDVICGGQAVRVSGTVEGDVRVAGSSVEIAGNIKGSVTVFGESLVIASEAKIGRDLNVGGARLKLEGEVARDVVGGTEVMVVSGKIGRHFDAHANSITLDSKTSIGGNVTYTSPTKAQIADDATIAGDTRFTQRTEQNNTGAAARFWGATFGFVAMLMIGLAALIGAPRGLDAVAVAIRRRPLIAFASGAAVLIVVPLVGVLLMVSVFGIPLGIVMLLLWGAGLISSLALGAYAIGWFTVEKLNWPSRGRRLASLLIGLLLTFLGGLLPLVGGLFLFFLMIIGLGAVAVVAGGKLRPAKPAVKKEA